MIRFENISWRSASFSIEGVNLDVPSGCYGILMGPTGCGKTTLAEILCGLRSPSTGRVFCGGTEISGLPPGRRGIGYVPQDGALFPTMSVQENLAFALRLQGLPKSERAKAVAPLAGQLGIAHLLERMPEHLSGGERQRVALGRALAARPAALVLDEPLSALDETTRDALIMLLQSLQKILRLTVLHITHHKHEAASLAQRLFRFENGRLSESPLPQ
jgi:ABC-type sugar transport system ATPase subunit